MLSQALSATDHLDEVLVAGDPLELLGLVAVHFRAQHLAGAHARDPVDAPRDLQPEPGLEHTLGQSSAALQGCRLAVADDVHRGGERDQASGGQNRECPGWAAARVTTRRCRGGGFQPPHRLTSALTTRSSVPYSRVPGGLARPGSRGGERPISGNSVNSPVKADYPRFGDPTDSTSFAVCLYDDGALLPPCRSRPRAPATASPVGRRRAPTAIRSAARAARRRE